MEKIECKRYPLKFWIRPGTSDIKAIREVVEKNSYQKKGMKIEPEDEWLDLGANIGAFSVMAAYLGARVIAYEPDPDSFELLKKNLKLNGMEKKVQAYNVAVTGDNQKSAWFSVSERNRNYWRNSLVKQWAGSRMIRVDCVNFDKVYRSSLCVKMDIEGSEMAILEKFPAPCRKLIFEWSFDIDPSIPRLKAVLVELKKLFPEVQHAKMPSVPEWKFFPAATMVYCAQPLISVSSL